MVWIRVSALRKIKHHHRKQPLADLHILPPSPPIQQPADADADADAAAAEAAAADGERRAAALKKQKEEEAEAAKRKRGACECWAVGVSLIGSCALANSCD